VSTLFPVSLNESARKILALENEWFLISPKKYYQGGNTLVCELLLSSMIICRSGASLESIFVNGKYNPFQDE